MTTRRSLMTLGASLALVSAASAQVNITTADGTTGADATLFNDSNRGPTFAAGTGGSIELRNYQAVRFRMPIIRFDISDLDASSNNAGATLSLSQEWGANRSRDWLVYGLRDGFDDSGTDPNKTENWDETTTSYDTAPGTVASALGTYALDVYDSVGNPGGAWELLHTEPAWGIAGIGGGPATMPTADLQSFIDADTDGKVTFLLVTSGVGDSSQYYGIVAKESGTFGPADFPTLVLPSATFADTDSDGLADFWENANFGDLSQDGTGDPDSDGFDNEAEETAGSDPNLLASVPGDIDGDGLDDTWETTNFGDITSQDGTGDPDSDGLTNEEEETGGSDPNDYQSFVDTDSDGQNDAWEVANFGDLVTDNDSAGDPDSDGYTNAEEYAAMTDPNDAGSIPGDSDADGVNDLWEDQYYGDNSGTVEPSDLTGTDGTPDPDSDGFTDAQESLDAPVASNPFDAASVPGDADADALDDSWEILYFGDITSNAGDDDPDLDLYTNEEEENLGTDPTDEFDFEDTDSDGQNDRWELQYFGDLGTSDDPFDDPDSDGDVNEDEYLFGSDPTNPASTINDIDGDGLVDSWEETYYAGTALWNRSDWVLSDFDGSDDMDGDGATNEEEETAGTSPIDAADAPDSDSDGLGDAWELAHFGDLTTSENGTDDNDSDGEDNATEFANLTDPTDALSTSDSDTDGLPDGWETNYFGDLTSGRNDDPDSDGDDNLTELRLGTDPSSAGSVTSPVAVSTANLTGGDIDLTNDGQNAGTGPTVQLGAGNGMQLRHWETVRLRIPMVRFDLNNVSGDTSGALLSLPTTFEVSNDPLNTVNVFALVDGSDGEDWDEATTSYSTAPGIIDGEELTQSVWSREATEVRYVGSIQLAPTGNSLSDTTSLDLDSLIAADTDGLITLFFTTRTTGDWWGIRTKEEALDTPSLIFPNGVTVAPPADSDSDGLTDVWEIANFGDLSQDGAGDPDGDGDDNLTEEANGTDPNSKSSFTDTDSDGLPDSWETATFGDLSQDGSTDSDSDGFSNTEEFWAGTDANNAGDAPVVPAATKVHQYTFNDDTFTDQVGSLNGTLDGAAAISGGALTLTGGTGELDGPTLAINTYDSVSVEFWATSNDAVNTGFSALFGIGEVNPSNNALASNYLLFATHRGDNFNRGAIGTNNQNGTPWLSEDGVNGAEINDNSEHHYVLVINDVTKQLHWYVDGVEIGQVTTQQDLADVATEFASVGALYPADAAWQGSVNEFAIYDGALSDTEVAANFAAGATVGTPSSVAVTDVSLSGTTLSVTLEGLVNGQDYHWEASTTLGGFTAIPASTFTGDGNPTQTENVTVDPVTNPSYYIRAVEGAAP